MTVGEPEIKKVIIHFGQKVSYSPKCLETISNQCGKIQFQLKLI